MTSDDTQLNRPTMSDNDRPSPTQSDHDGHSPTMSATRSDTHTMTTTEVTKFFEDAGLPREKRSIERYCEQGKLDCFKDPDELRYFITRGSAEQLVGHLKEIKQRHAQEIDASRPLSTTTEDPVRQRATSTSDAGSVKPETSKNSGAETDREAQEKKIKELEDQIFNLEIDKRAKDKVVTMLRDQIKDDRDHYSDKLTKFGQKVEQLETQMKQLKAADTVATTDDNEGFEGDAIDAEFTEGSAV